MKKIIYSILFLQLTNLGISQPYNFTATTDPYIPLTGTTSINGSTVWSYATSFSVSIGFTFNFMGNNYSSIFIEGGGFTFFDAGYNYMILPFGVALKDKGTSSTLSPISYVVEGVTPNRIFKVEWNNADYFNDPGSTANFQLWLHESTNIIQTHVGTCTVLSPSAAYSWNSDNGPSIGIYEYSGTNCLYGFALTGSPVSPTENNFLSGTGINVFNYSLNNTPAANNVYTFLPVLGNIEEGDKENNQFNVYYDGSTAKLYYESLIETIDQITIYDIYGNQVFISNPNVKSGELNLTNKINCSAFYIVNATLKNKKIISRKLILFK